MKRLAASIAVAIACTGGIGQTVHMHGDPTDRPARDLPPPVLIAGVGKSHLAITTSSRQAQAWFDQGLSLMHCFWDFEALRAFREAARLDPDRAMCQWGIYRAMKSLEGEDADGGARESDRLDALLWRFTRDRDESDRTAQRVGEILGVASKELSGNVASARGDYRQARELLGEAADMEKKLGYSEPPLYSRPSLESLGYAAIRAHDWETARSAFRQVLVLRPKSGFGYYGIALAYDKEGNRSAAGKAYQEFLASWQHADEDLAMVRAARAAMARLNAGSRPAGAPFAVHHQHSARLSPVYVSG